MRGKFSHYNITLINTSKRKFSTLKKPQLNREVLYLKHFKIIELIATPFLIMLWKECRKAFYIVEEHANDCDAIHIIIQGAVFP